jgi:PleD family two-component response regulator
MQVLVGDDNLQSSTAILSQLSIAGHRPTRARTEADALRIVQRLLPDLVLLNLAARSFDPFDLIKTFRGAPTLKEKRIVGFCGHLEHARRAKAQEAGCDHIITNAAAMGQLAAVLKTL